MAFFLPPVPAVFIILFPNDPKLTSRIENSGNPRIHQSQMPISGASLTSVIMKPKDVMEVISSVSGIDDLICIREIFTRIALQYSLTTHCKIIRTQDYQL